MNTEIRKLTSKAQGYAKELEEVLSEVKKVIVGQDEILHKLIICLVADGHVLLEGFPGLAKTLMIKTLAETMSSTFHRIQFTPDLLPADIVGTNIYEHKTASFIIRRGPIFANCILADEINRAPPKVQSALLEAMQERQVTIQGETLRLEELFLVLATQNPIETEGTYKLPEAQVDRFMFKLLIKYPTKIEEKEIIKRTTKANDAKVKKVISPAGIVKIQKFCKEIYGDEKIEDYVTSIVDATRNPKNYGLEFDGHIEVGASPRATIWLIMAAKAHALLQARGYVLPEDVQYICHDVLRHRIILSYEAEAEEITADQIISKILEKVKVP